MKKSLLILILAAGIPIVAKCRDRHPNIILILSDDQGYGDLSSHGHPNIKTPNLDRLKDQSVEFTNFFVAPVCSPTRASLLTGRYHYRTGVHDTYQSRVNMRSEEVTIAEYLKGSGYTTGLFGKWHLGYNYPMRPCDQGFDKYITWEEMQHTRLNPLLEEDGKFIFYDGFLSDIFFSKAVEFIEENKSRPFFCYYPLYLPHTHPDNLQIPEKYYKHYPSNIPKFTAEQYGMVEKEDELVGKLMAKLDSLGLSDNTIIIWTSDNGSTRKIINGTQIAYNAGLRGFKTQVYDGGIKVPFFIRFPKQKYSNTKVTRMVNYTDMLPTILDLCDIKPRFVNPIDGISLKPLIENPNLLTPERYFYMQFARGGKEKILSNIWENSTIRGETYKLVNGNELYNIKTDTCESIDISSQMPEKVKELRTNYEKWFNDVFSDCHLIAESNIIGNSKQKTVNLFFFEKDQESQEKGWPVRIINEGPYNVAIENIQHEMFGPNAECIINIGNVQYRKKVNKNLIDLVFENIKLPIGDHIFELEISDRTVDKKWRYGLDDLGHRLIRITKID